MSKDFSEENCIEKMYHELLNGDFQSSFKIYEEYLANIHNSDFINRILKPVMNKIEEGINNDKINPAANHVAKNIAQTLLKIISENNKD